jgi:hypothetical protein
MIANVMKAGILTRGYVTAGRSSDLYVFDLDDFFLTWKYRGKHVGESFIGADVQGSDHIPPEWFAALECAWHSHNGFCEFEDPHESLEAVV